jgi:hypothetical protein
MSATYTPIASITLGAVATSVTFTNIPQTYTDLVLVAKPAEGADIGAYFVTFNSDTGTNYSSTRIYGSGTSVASDRQTNQVNITSGWGGGTYNLYTTHIMNYANTTTYKTALTRITENRYVVFMAGLWRNTNAISTIRIANNDVNYGVGSTFNLYGILGANA